MQGNHNDDGIGFVNIASGATLSGTLAFQFENAFASSVQPTDTFTVLSATSPLTGSFTNVSSGGLLSGLDGSGTFQVYYGASSPFGDTNLVFTGFTAVPEPSTMALIMLGLGILGRVRRSKSGS